MILNISVLRWYNPMRYGTSMRFINSNGLNYT